LLLQTGVVFDRSIWSQLLLETDIVKLENDRVVENLAVPLLK